MASRPENTNAFSALDALEVLIRNRHNNHVVVTHQGSARIWPSMASHPLDFHYNPSTMGGAIPLGLGLALARKRSEIIVVTGDGALLMSLGCLVTVAAARPPNLTIVVLDNGRYEVTGGQSTAGAVAAIDYSGVARHCGIDQIHAFNQLDEWTAAWPMPLQSRGPRLISLRVEPVPQSELTFPTPPILAQTARLRKAFTEFDTSANELDC